jgi:biotin operon repressor
MAKSSIGITDEVLIFLKKNKNTNLIIGEVADATGVTTQQVSMAVNNLRRSGVKIDSPKRGWYIYRGGNTNHRASKDSKAEVVTVLDSGELLLKVEGTLYVATELEI